MRRYDLVVTDTQSNSTIGALQGFVVLISEGLAQAVFTFTSAQGTFQVSWLASCVEHTKPNLNRFAIFCPVIYMKVEAAVPCPCR